MRLALISLVWIMLIEHVGKHWKEDRRFSWRNERFFVSWIRESKQTSYISTHYPPINFVVIEILLANLTHSHRHSHCHHGTVHARMEGR